MISKQLKIFLLVVFLAAFSLASAQQQVLKGTVTDAKSGEPLPGVTIVIKGTVDGVITDIDGQYTLNVLPNQVLQFSYIGYTTQEITVGNSQVLNVAMVSSNNELEEVMVIGYGKVKKGDATGSVAAVSSDDFNKGAITAPQELLMGKAAGVTITAPSGQPGAGSTIRIRGGSSLSASNDPLIVVDNVPISGGVGGSGNSLAMINPNDIATMTVLKDASATAIYGSRASNGVILITTKKGGKGFKVNYNTNLSIGTPIKTLEVLSGDEFRKLIQDRVDNYGLTAEALKRVGKANTDWQKEIYQNAFSHDHNLSVGGTALNIPYRASLGFTDQNGLLKNSNMQRNTLAINLSPSFLNNTLKVNANAKGTYTTQNFSNTGAIGNALQFDPTQPIKNKNTKHRLDKLR